jgi:hypothetical protein
MDLSFVEALCNDPATPLERCQQEVATFDDTLDERITRRMAIQNEQDQSPAPGSDQQTLIVYDQQPDWLIVDRDPCQRPCTLPYPGQCWPKYCDDTVSGVGGSISIGGTSANGNISGNITGWSNSNGHPTAGWRTPTWPTGGPGAGVKQPPPAQGGLGFGQ